MDSDAKGCGDERLILAKIEGRFTLMGVPREPLDAPRFFIRSGKKVEGPMTFLQCRVRLDDYLDEPECDLVERPHYEQRRTRDGS